MKMKTQPTGTCGHSKGSPERKVYIKRTERSQINDLMLHLKVLEKQEQANPKKNQKKRNDNNKD
jgi:hypothetical protein